MIGDSTDWPIGLRASIEKWEQEDVHAYGRNTKCGLCMVVSNRGVSCYDCPADHICGKGYIDDSLSAETVLQMLQAIDLKEEW